MEERTQTTPETQPSNTFNPDIFNNTIDYLYAVVEDNKVLLANASNKFDVYPITYTNCVRLNHTKTLDEFIEDERGRLNDIEKSIYNLLLAEISRSTTYDNTHTQNINNINTFINESVISSIGDGLTYGDESTVTDKGGITTSNSVKVNAGKGLTFDNGQLALNISTDDLIFDGNVVKINLDKLKQTLKAHFDGIYKPID